MYVLLLAYPWDAIKVHGERVVSGDNRLTRFLPVFDTREDAESFRAESNRPDAEILYCDDISAERGEGVRGE